MVNCCVPNCSSRSDRKGNINADGSKITFHGFPHDPDIKRTWLLKIRRQGKKPNELWTPNRSSVVCSKHFEPGDFKSGLRYRLLLRSAIPSRFADNSQEIPKKINSNDLNSSGAKRDQTLIPNEKGRSQKLFLDPKLVQVWSCSEKAKECEPTIPTNGGIDNLPSFMKQALLEKQKIDSTYEGTSAVDTNVSTGNGNLQSEQLELGNPNINNIKMELDSVPYFESSDLHSTSNSIPILPNDSRVLKVKMCDASTITIATDDVARIKRQLENYKKVVEISRKKTKGLQQINRRLRKRLIEMKHIVFCELQNRQYLSKFSDFNSEKQGCLLDRHSVTVCESSDSEEYEED